MKGKNYTKCFAPWVHVGSGGGGWQEPDSLSLIFRFWFLKASLPNPSPEGKAPPLTATGGFARADTEGPSGLKTG